MIHNFYINILGDPLTFAQDIDIIIEHLKRQDFEEILGSRRPTGGFLQHFLRSQSTVKQGGFQ